MPQEHIISFEGFYGMSRGKVHLCGRRVWRYDLYTALKSSPIEKGSWNSLLDLAGSDLRGIAATHLSALRALLPAVRERCVNYETCGLEPSAYS